MKKIIFVMLRIFFTIVTSESIDENQLTTRDYSDLIEDIYNYTKSTSVTLIHFTNDGNLIQKNKIFQMQKLLLRKNFINVSDINLRLISNLTDERFHNFKGLRKDNSAISFFLLSSVNDFNEMKKYTILLNRSKVINFVVFMKDDDSDKIYSDICQNPKDNAFDLNEGVSILVKCLTNVTIQEWHSINSSSINIISRATWEAKKKPRFTLESRTLSVGNREAIEGKVLRAVIIKESRAIGEYFPKLIEALEEAGNFSFTFVENDERGIYDEDKKTWSGAMGLVVNKQVDIALGWFTYLPNGFSVVDYTVTIDRAEFVILIKEPKTKTVISWTAFFQPFTLETWLALLFLFIIIQVIRVFLKSKTRSSSQEQTFGADDFFHICGIFLHKHQPSTVILQ